MPRLGGLLKLLRYAPLAFEVARSMMPASREEPEEMRTELEEYHKRMSDHIADLENDLARLRARLRETESALNDIQLKLWIGGGALGFLVILLFIAVVALMLRQ